MEIPIKNIYYILSYAWKYFKFNDISAIDKKDFQTTTEFFGELFDLSFTRYIKKGLQRDYISYNEELKTIKSKIDFGTTLKKVGFKSKKFHCIYDEYTINNLTNQVIKSTAFLLIKSEIRQEQKKSIKKKLVFLSGIESKQITKKTLKQLKRSRDNYNLNFLLDICSYIILNSSFKEDRGKHFLSDFTNENSMPAIFENFILNFYKKNLKDFKVKGSEQIKWDSETESVLYPVMKTDVTIRNSEITYIIDTKYYKDMFQYNFNTPKFRSNNIYQIFTYLNNFKESHDGLEGMLLYPSTHSKIRNERIISGKKISINTVNLNQEWNDVESELLEIIK